jgi:hypothetical protein
MEHLDSFIIVFFLSDLQSNFIKIRDALYEQSLSARVVKSESVFGNASNLIKFNNSLYCTSVNSLSKCPVYVIKNEKKYDNILKNFKVFKQDTFLEKKMYVLGCFNKGKVYSSAVLFNINNPKKSFAFLLPMNQKISFLFFSPRFNVIFVLKLLYIYKESIKPKK